MDQPARAADSPRSASRPSATTAVPASFTASAAATLTLTKRTCGQPNAVRDAVVKSLYLVPIPITTSACAAIRLAAAVPVLPSAPRASGWSNGRDPFPAWVSATGTPAASANARSSAVASA